MGARPYGESLIAASPNLPCYPACPQCNAAKRKDALFCVRCGRYLPGPRPLEIFTDMGRRLRRAAFWNIALAFGAYFLAPPAGIIIGLIVAPLYVSGDMSGMWAATALFFGLFLLALPLFYFSLLYDRVAKVRCAACGAALALEVAERGCFCYLCGTRYRAGRGSIPIRCENMATASTICGFCTAALEAGDLFCPACGANAVSAQDRAGAPPWPSGNVCPLCGDKILNRRFALFTMRAPQAVYCPACGLLLKPRQREDRDGEKQV